MNALNLLMLFLLLSVAGCGPDMPKKQTDVERLRLNGAVKSYLETIQRNSNYIRDTTEPVLKEVHREYLLFNTHGNITEKKSFKWNGEPHRIWMSIYDNDQNEIELIEIKPPHDTLKRWIRTYNAYEVESIEMKYPNDTLKRRIERYDANGNEVESLTYDHKDSLLSHTRVTFDGSNNKTAYIYIKSEKEKDPLLKVTYEYDNNGNRIKTTRHYADKSKAEWFTEYDSVGNEIEWRVYDRKGKLKRRDTYVYDENSNLLEERLFTSDNVLETMGVSEYDKEGREIKFTEYLYDSIRSSEIKEYDELGNVTITYLNRKGEPRSRTQIISEFDENENLIKELEYKNGKLIAIKEYKIEYYQ
ncbi:hypothetical protein POV27_07390 [Aureisphaera galaxeae]|uniref:hypothetical protein n=1 Tax=Aureisphaera galaxeae TaxID=1538023 RepID=UPI0023504792|nr:hypothetical protein [Aureisphaera galaxeae]MDC8003870.1 hypothetical protein [Aureisphaera galaxeae]